MPTDFRGTFKVKTPVNTTRYGEGDIECDNSLVLKEQATPSTPSSTYHKIYVDNTSRRLRIKDSLGVPRNVGMISEQISIELSIPNGGSAATPTARRTFVLNGSQKGGVPISIDIIFTHSASAGTFGISIVDANNTPNPFYQQR